MERRLAAILSADVVGYTRLMGVDEAGTLRRLTDLREKILEPLIAEHHGRVVKLMGDGLLVEFGSAVDSVACAIAWQDSVALHGANRDASTFLQFRIGINLGDIIVEGDDIHGDGVNIAARLEGLAEPGGICLSDDIYRHAKGKIETQFEDMGEQDLKNVADPIRVYSVAVEQSSATAPVSAIEPLPLPEKPSIAVLPFDNMSGDPEQEYFSDGITEDLITELSRFKELAVLSRNSSFFFKGKNEDLKEVGRKLNARYILEGSVRKAGKRVRVTAQLIDTAKDQHIWAERYDRGLEDIFEVQDDLVRHITSILVGRLEARRLTTVRQQSIDQLKAYDLFLRAREHFFGWSLENNNKARKYLCAALELEPNNAAALALLSEVLLRMWLNGWSNDPDQDLKQAFNLATRAVEIDDSDSRTLTALGMACLFNGYLDRARAHFDGALRVNPNDMRVIVYYSRHAVFEGDVEKAVDLCRQAQELNPYGKYNWNLGLASFVARNYGEVVSLLSSIQNPPATVLALLAASYAMLGDEDKAASAYRRFTSAIGEAPMMKDFTEPNQWRNYYAQRWPFRNPNHFEHLTDALRKAGMPI
ncbi:MAG TPA: adenylate/guanylate cyclase domain-containing protein [Sedimentisphaerales bacterium]|nr:adenylate/guanylate cyclase domain-containing protein [Sedimentisphaerales bacterium]